MKKDHLIEVNPNGYEVLLDVFELQRTPTELVGMVAAKAGLAIAHVLQPALIVMVPALNAGCDGVFEQQLLGNPLPEALTRLLRIDNDLALPTSPHPAWSSSCCSLN